MSHSIDGDLSIDDRGYILFRDSNIPMKNGSKVVSTLIPEQFGGFFDENRAKF
jgi:hypothetical protein